MADGTPLGNMRIKLELDDAQFGKGVANSKKQIKYLAKEMQANMKIADMAGNTQAKLGAKFESLSKIIQAQERQVADLKREYDESFVKGKATDSTKRLAAELQNANGKLANYKKQLIDSAGAIAEYQVKNEGLTGAIYKNSERLIKAGDKMSNLGGKLTTGLTVPILAGVGAVTKAAIDWESAFAGVRKTNDEVVDSTGKVVYSYSDLENGLRDLAKELPSSHQEIAAVAEAAGQLGIQTKNVTAFTKTMIDLGESTNMTAETAATELARFANIVGMSQDKFDNLGSALVDLGNNYATTEAEISAMALRLAGAGKQIGMSEGDILGFSAALSSVGIEAEAGGSAFSKVMVNMQLATEKGVGAFDDLKESAAEQGVSWEELVLSVRDGGKALKNTASRMGTTSSELKKMYKLADKNKTSLESFSNVAGMTGDQFAKMFKSNPTKAIMAFVKGLSEAEKNGSSAIKVLDDMDIKEVRLRDSLLRAANASGIFGDAVETGNKAFKENTALTEEANKRYETTESKLKMLKNEVVDVAIDMGGPFVDALRDTVQAGKPVIKFLADGAKAFNDMDPKTQQAIVKFVAFTAAAGPLLKITGKVTGGIGSLGQSFIDLSASMAKKKAIAEVTKQMAEGAVSAGDFGKVMASGADDVLKFGGAASTAAGGKGIGAMVTALGTGGGLASALPVIVGAGGLLAVGYGAWKLFGEEAWNSSQRVKRWGEDVGVATDETLKNIQDKTQSANGEFGLMAQGFETNTDSMITNFQKIGSTIENDLTNKLSAYKQAVDLLPEELQAKANEYFKKSEQDSQHALEIVQKNNEEVLRIKKEYVDKEGNVTVQGSKMIQDLMRDSTEEYLNIAIDDADKRKKVMNALTGDLSSATEKQAEDWLVSLAKQRQATKASYTEDIANYRKKIESTGQLSKEEIDTVVGFYEDAQKTSTDAFDAQMALIVQKYPELAEKISLANGQMIDSASGANEAFITENQKIIDNAANLADELSAKSRETAEQLAWTADQTTLAGKTWNNLKLIDKEGKIKTNAAEIVTEATKDSETWNNMRLVLHDANLDSNAKLVIGEAAIANGWWDGMAWEDKQAVLENEFQQTMFEALRSSGQWDMMSFEEKKAILYSNTPEKMTETMANLGLWDEYQPEIKNLGAENTKLLEVLLVSEDRMKHWNELPDSVKEIMANNYDLTTKIYQSERMFNAWKEIPDSEKKMLGNNEDVLTKILNSENALKDWNSMPEIEKKILGNNLDLLSKVYRSEDSIMAWNKLPINVKAMLGDNVDILSKVRDGTISVDDYNKNVIPNLKVLYGDESDLQNALSGATGGINSYNQNAIPSTKTMVGVDAASGPADNAFNSVLNFKNNLPDLITKTVQAQYLETHSGPMRNAKGTNYHPGGPMIVNDQQGPIYREMVVRPSGEAFIPFGKNVLLPNEPVGTKVYTAAKTKRLVPRYANGIGVPENSSLVRNLRSISTQSVSAVVSSKQDYSKLENKMDMIVKLLAGLLDKDQDIILDGKAITKIVDKYQKNQQRLNTIKTGGRTI
nr:phage tail tape measure protein [Enterococcus diestrammenae]